ncbi:MAG: polymer-forming cytoskeletal protein [Gemmatimonadetes bacterium]|nr:polymer-forming cytoskeletal protein [Gemmatimonadota bacterium]
MAEVLRICRREVERICTETADESELDLANTRLGDAALAPVSHIKTLRYLSLHGTKITDAGMTRLKALRGLYELKLSQTAISDQGLQSLTGMNMLATLLLGGTRITDEGLAHIGKLRSLRTLSLASTRIGDIGLGYLTALTSLEELYLNGTRVSDACVQTLAGLPSLRKINLRDTQVNFIAYAIPVCMFIMAAEIIFNFVLNLYRPRVADEVPRPAFDSRVLSLLSAPDSIVKSINEAVNYQFGFDVTSSWGYQLLLRSFFWLLAFGAGVLVLLNTMVVVEPHQQAVRLRGGEIVGDVHSSELLELQPKARITGNVFYKALEMHGGALVSGKLSHDQQVETPLLDLGPELQLFGPRRGILRPRRDGLRLVGQIDVELTKRLHLGDPDRLALQGPVGGLQIRQPRFGPHLGGRPSDHPFRQHRRDRPGGSCGGLGLRRQGGAARLIRRDRGHQPGHDRPDPRQDPAPDIVADASDGRGRGLHLGEVGQARLGQGGLPRGGLRGGRRAEVGGLDPPHRVGRQDDLVDGFALGVEGPEHRQHLVGRKLDDGLPAVLGIEARIEVGGHHVGPPRRHARLSVRLQAEPAGIGLGVLDVPEEAREPGTDRLDPGPIGLLPNDLDERAGLERTEGVVRRRGPAADVDVVRRDRGDGASVEATLWVALTCPGTHTDSEYCQTTHCTVHTRALVEKDSKKSQPRSAACIRSSRLRPE